MATRKQISFREQLLLAHFYDAISLDDFALGWILSSESSKTRKRRTFALSKLTDTFCLEFFRFTKVELQSLRENLGIPEEVKIANSVRFTGIEGLCILLARLNIAGNLGVLVKIFHRDRSSISRIFNYMLDFVYQQWNHLLTSLNHPWLTAEELYSISELIRDCGSIVPNAVGFLDETVVKICRPRENHKEYYSGVHRCHVIKYQALTLANGIVVRLFGAYKGRPSHIKKIATIKVTGEIRAWKTSEGRQCCVYGDKQHASVPFVYAINNSASYSQELFSNKIRLHKSHLEYGFGKVLNLFPFCKIKKRIFLQPVNKIYTVATILSNCLSCLRGTNQMTLLYGCKTPTLKSYLWKLK